jgi:hypothetical protein
VQIKHEVDQSPFQTGPLAQQRDETTLSNANGSFGVKQVQTFGDLPVFLEIFSSTRRAPAAHFDVVVLAGAIRTVNGWRIREGEQLIADLSTEGFFLILKNGHFLFDQISLIAECNHLFSTGIGTALNFLPYLLADSIALALKGAALLLKVALMLQGQLELCQIDRLTASTQLPGNVIRIVSDETLIDHGSGCNSAGSLWQSVQST